MTLTRMVSIDLQSSGKSLSEEELSGSGWPVSRSVMSSLSSLMEKKIDSRKRDISQHKNVVGPAQVVSRATFQLIEHWFLGQICFIIFNSDIS